MSRIRLSAILFSFFVLCLNITAQVLPFSVRDTRITRNEFFEAYQHRLEYNQVRDTTLDWLTKKKVEVAVFRTLSDEEKEAYIWTDYAIDNIGRYPSGEYIADLWYCNWAGAVFVDEDFKADSTVINGSVSAAYSKTGVYAGCEGFDCDHIAWIHFYIRKDGRLSQMEEVAVYKNSHWKLTWWEEFPEFEGLDYANALVWYKDALYCMGVENYDDENGQWCTRPIFIKLEMVPFDEMAKEFITRMYDEKLYEDYGFLQKHCSGELKKKLQDAFPYDTDDTDYATWLFRSGHQDSKPGSDGKTMAQDVTGENGWYVYSGLDMGWEFNNKIRLSNKDGRIIIEDISITANN